jgi:large subunit ribosomal protein L9
VKTLEKEGIQLERKNVVLPHPIKELGVHKIQLKLKEGVPASFTLKINSDKPLPQRAVVEEKVEPVEPTEST